MNRHPTDPLNRRSFLRRAGQLATVGAATPLGLNLAAMGEAAAFGATDYKALVCVFLYGGNDHANTVVSYDDASWSAYRAIRKGGLALERALLTGTALTPATALAAGRSYALNNAMPQMASLFNNGKAAVLLNVGPLIRPTTRAEYFNPDRARYPLPSQLLSHNDQQSVWQSQGAEGSTAGWGGRLGDLALSNNGNSLFTCISATGNGVFLSGNSAVQFQMTTVGAVPINATVYAPHGLRSAPYSAHAGDLLRALITEPRVHVLEDEYNRITRRAVAAESQVTAALSRVAIATAFPQSNSLADELKIVAKMIGAREVLGNKRQVFLVSLGGFDFHDELVSAQARLLRKVSEAMDAFYQATVELGVADKITTFTASDFGRALASNGNGTDHGWGGHHFVVGGAVRGQSFYGTPPPISIGDSDLPQDQWHIGQGRLIPTTSVDQYGATLGRWFGVADSELRQIFPNLNRFGITQAGINYPVDLGFMK